MSVVQSAREMMKREMVRALRADAERTHGKFAIDVSGETFEGDAAEAKFMEYSFEDVRSACEDIILLRKMEREEAAPPLTPHGILTTIRAAGYCPYGDPLCPCGGGSDLACHYQDVTSESGVKTEAWQVEPEHVRAAIIRAWEMGQERAK